MDRDSGAEGRWKHGASGRLVRWALYYGAAPVAAVEAICVNSIFTGQLAGEFGAFGLFAVVLATAAFFLTPARERHTFFSRLLAVFAAVAIPSMFVLKGKVATLQMAGQSSARISMVPTLAVLLVQLGLAAFYWFRAHQRPSGPSRGQRARLTRWAWAPVVTFVPLFLAMGGVGIGIFGWGNAQERRGAPNAHAAESVGPGSEKYSHFPKPADFAFARESVRIGEDSGGQFIHYHTGRRPLLGLAFSNREWFGKTRLSSDLRGIFDREAPAEGNFTLLAEPGYVVSGLQAQVEEHVLAVRVRFSSLEEFGHDEPRLNMNDSYWSGWLGGFERGMPIQEIGNTGDMVWGLTGTAGLVVNSLALMIDQG